MDSNETSLDVHDHGKYLEKRKQKVECKYCGKVVTGFTRLKYHIGSIRGDVLPCEKAPLKVKELMKNSLLERKKNIVGQMEHSDLPLKRNWCQSSGLKFANFGNSELNVFRRKKHLVTDSKSDYNVTKMEYGKIDSQAAVDSSRHDLNTSSRHEKDSSLKQFQKCVGSFFYEVGLDVHAAESPSFQKLIMNTTHNRDKFQIPNPRDLKGWILEEEVKEMKQYVDEIRRSWAFTGCSILLDGWSTNTGQKLLNFLVDCPKGAIYLKSADVSDSVQDPNALCRLLDGVIHEVGTPNVIQIISHSTSDEMIAVGKQLMEKHTSLFWTISASHCLELMLKKIESMDIVQEVLGKAKFLVRFIHNRAPLLQLLRNHTDGRGLFRSFPKSKTASIFLTLENIVTKKTSLQNMFLTCEWKDAFSKVGRKVGELDLIGDHLFWSMSRHILGVAIPLVRVLCLLDEGDKQRLGYIYETIDQVKETVSEDFEYQEEVYMPFWELIDWIWNNHLHSPLHSAGYFLNPALKYSTDFCYDEEVGSGLLSCVIRLGQDVHTQELINQQMDKYRKSNGLFRVGGEAMKCRHSLRPDLWWGEHGRHVPELQRLAVRILGQTCDGALKYGLKRSLAEKVVVRGGNRIEQQYLKDLTYVHYNLHLKNYKANKGGEDEIEWTHEWVADETVKEEESVKLGFGNVTGSMMKEEPT